MPVKQRPQWTAVEIAAHAMEATSLSQLTLPEVKRMAASILAAVPTMPATADGSNLQEISAEELAAKWPNAQKFVD